jgi:hypothetical protein
VPLFGTGVIDVEAASITNQMLMNRAVKNLLVTRSEDDEIYAVRRGGDFINTYPRRDEHGDLSDGGVDDPNHLLGAFPTLFPYGRGGFETNRKRLVSYAKHARWALQYGDGQFRKNIAFVSQVFSVMQRRQVAMQSLVQMNRRDFHQFESAISRITPQDLLDASIEEEKHVKFTNKDVQVLWDHISATRSRVMATDESRTKYRSMMWSMVAALGPPSLWITLNPSDTHDPIVQVFAGHEIDMDAFRSDEGPDADTRARTVASDPYSATKFFHLSLVSYSKNCLA